MASQGQFQSATERCAMQSSEHRFFESLDTQQHVIEQRCARWRLEFAQIGAGDETPAGPYYDDAQDAWIPFRRLHGRQQRCPHGLAQRIDRWILDLEDRDTIVRSQSNRYCHRAAVLS